MNVFIENMEMIESHNAKNPSYTLGLNKFSDMTPEEL